jgi:hypothetical protein
MEAIVNSLPADPPLSGRIYGGDRTAGLIVLEDLGEGECLADLLQGHDRARLEAGLMTYAASLGELHASTIGREAECERRRAALGGSGSSASRRSSKRAAWSCTSSTRAASPATRSSTDSRAYANGYIRALIQAVYR